MKSAIRRSKRLAGLMLAVVSLLSSVFPKGHCRVEADLNDKAAFGSTSTPTLAKADASTETRVKEAYGNLPLSFEAVTIFMQALQNQAWCDGDNLYTSRGRVWQNASYCLPACENGNCFLPR